MDKKEHTYTLGIEEEFAIVDPGPLLIQNTKQVLTRGYKLVELPSPEVDQASPWTSGYLHVRQCASAVSLGNQEITYEKRLIGFISVL
jgi:hypothetical protein